MNINELKDAEEFWDKFKSGLDEEGKKELGRFTEPANSLSLFYYFATENYIKFDQIINTLSKQYLYDENLIPIVFNCYAKRNLPDQSFKYINDAQKYYAAEGKTSGIDLAEYRRQATNNELFDKLRDTLMQLRSLAPEDVPPIVPDTLNGKIKLHEFILGEIVNGLRIMRKKIRAVHSINDEDRYNDVLLATLRLRLAVWGWDISDQEFSGVTAGGPNPGELDHTIKGAGRDLALIEAFTLVGGNFPKVEKHILKCNNYIRDLQNFYIVVYFIGDRTKFESCWKTYQTDVERITFPSTWPMIANSFEELPANIFPAIENMKLAKTRHLPNYELFHLMIDLSEPETVPSKLP